MARPSLFGTDVVRDHIREIPDNDVQIGRLAQEATARIESIARRRFSLRSVVALLNNHQPDGYSGRVQTPDYPLVSVSLVEVADGSGGWTALVATDYQVDLTHGWLTSYRWPVGFGCVRVTYQVGWAQDSDDIPGDLYGAGLDLCKYLWDTRKVGAVAQETISLGPITATRAARIPRDIMDVINSYRRIRLGG